MDWAEALAQVEVQVKEANRRQLAVMLADLALATGKIIRRLEGEVEAPPSPLLTIDQLATRLQVQPGTLYQRVRRGQLAATRIGKLIRVREQDAIKAPEKVSRVRRLV